jgi:glycosyltransferase involved in cell wall biosynthesis
MKLALVTAFPPSKVTLNEYGYHLAKNFVNNQEVLSLILLTDHTENPKQLDFENAKKVKVNECWGFNKYRNIFTIIKAVFKEKPDYILFNLQFVKFGDKKIPSALGLFTPFFLRLFGFKTMVLMHNIMETVDLKNAGFSDNKLLQTIYNWIGTSITYFLLKANKVSVTIQKYVEVLNKKYKAKNVVLIPHGTFETMKDPLFDGEIKTHNVMAFGKFGTYKKVDIMIEALEMIKKRTNYTIETVVAGTDSPNTPGYLEGVKQKFSAVSNLIFTGYVPEEDVERIFSESTVVVFPYTSTTGSSGVLHQAGSYGKAVVMPELGDLALLVEEEGYKGEFFDPLSAESLADAIEKLIVDDAYRIAMAKNNYEAASALSMDKICDKFIQELKKI